MKQKQTKFKRFIRLMVVSLGILIIATLYGCSEQVSTQQDEQLSIDFTQQKELALLNLKSLQNEYHDTELKLNQIHEQANEIREQIKELDFKIYGNEETIPVMSKICELSPESPMCDNWELLMDLKDVAEKRDVNYKLLLGIMYAESHIGVNFKPSNCAITNNRAGLKARKYDDGTISEWYNKQYESLNIKGLDGCWLYYFEDTHQFFESLANTISLGYAKCKGDVYCIGGTYVGHDSAARTNNVWKFYSL